MFILKSIPKKRIWGTPRLQAYSTESCEGKIGSVYSASATEEIDSPVVSEQQTLRELVQENPQSFGLLEGEEYPLIISMTGADEDLSIQVHPTDDYAEKTVNKPYGKSEAWFFLTSPKSGSIITGQTAASKQAFMTAIQENKYETILGKTTVAKESIVYIPSGTIHALTKGALVYEIQQSTDITYRFYDYDRSDDSGIKRELHTKQATETLKLQQTVLKANFDLGQTLDVKEFTVRRALLAKNYRNQKSLAQVITVLTGITKIAEQEIKQGQSIIVLPDEQLVIDTPFECMIATPKAYWRETSV